MTQQSLEQTQEVSTSISSDTEPHSPTVAEASGKSPRLVPVNEAIKYRRRAQQAESGLQQIEQKLKDTQTQLDERLEQLAAAEARGDELQHQIDTLQVRSTAERMFRGGGVTDVEAAMALLEKRIELSEDLDEKQMQQAVSQLLHDKPILTAASPDLPGKTASPRLQNTGAHLAQSAARAARTGSRRDVAEYLRLRRQGNKNY